MGDEWREIRSGNGGTHEHERTCRGRERTESGKRVRERERRRGTEVRGEVDPFRIRQNFRI